MDICWFWKTDGTITFIKNNVKVARMSRRLVVLSDSHSHLISSPRLRWLNIENWQFTSRFWGHLYPEGCIYWGCPSISKNLFYTIQGASKTRAKHFPVYFYFIFYILLPFQDCKEMVEFIIQRISTEYGSISSRISQNSNPHKLLMKLAGAQLKDDVDSQTSLYPHPLAL